jgi:hypothetical protein
MVFGGSNIQLAMLQIHVKTVFIGSFLAQNFNDISTSLAGLRTTLSNMSSNANRARLCRDGR